MYNIYIYEKRKEEENRKKQEAKRIKVYNANRIKINSKLIKNYTKRVENFIYDQCENPLILSSNENNDKTNPTNPNYNFRNRNSLSTSSSKKFIFKTFLTDHERIAKYLEENKSVVQAQHNNKKKILSSTVSSFNMKQPNMRFKPRNDIDRVIDAINENNYGIINQDDINKQNKIVNMLIEDIDNDEKELNIQKYNIDYKVLNLIMMERDRLKGLKTSNKKIKNRISKLTTMIDTVNKRKKKEKNKTESKKVIKLYSRNKDNNYVFQKKLKASLAKNILNEYHIKTHFQAASVFSLNLSSHQNNSTSTSFIKIPKLKKTNKHTTPSASSTKVIFKDINNFASPSNKKYPSKDIEYIKSLSMSNSTTKASSHYLGYDERRYKPKIIIDNIPYDHDDLPSISKAILKSCNYIAK